MNINIYDISANDISGNDVSGNDVSENDVSERTQQKIKLDMQKKQWISYCELLVKVLKKDKNLMSLKLKDLRARYDAVHIYVIIVSSILTCFETIKIEFNIPQDSSWDSALSLLTLFLTASIVISMAITKYLRYSEMIQNILIISNQGVETIYKLRQAIEDTASCESVRGLRMEVIKNKKEACTPFYKVREEIDRHLPIHERVKYNKKYAKEIRKNINNRKKLWKQKKKDLIDISGIEQGDLDKARDFIFACPYGDEADKAWDDFWKEKLSAEAKYILPIPQLMNVKW